MFAAYESLTENVLKYALQGILIFFTVPGFIWAFSLYALRDVKNHSTNNLLKNKSLGDKCKVVLEYYLNYLRTTFILFLPFFLLVALTGKLMLQSDITAFSNAMQFLTGLAILIAIITLAALSHGHHKKWKIQLQRTKKLLMKKPFSFLFNSLIAAIPVGLSTYLLYLATLVKEHFPLMILTASLTVTSIIFARLYIILVGRNLIQLDKDKLHAAKEHKTK